MRRALVAAAFMAALSARAEGPAQGRWRFEVTLDGERIGRHEFTLETRAGERVLRSDARFEVRLLGFTVYRYEHHDQERWRGDCLVAMDASTADGSARHVVKVGEGGEVIGAGGAQVPLPACVMSFAYWHPGMLQQHRLLNAETGRLEEVRVRRMPDESLDGVPARHFRIEGLPHAIDLWYDVDGGWLGLASTVGGGRRLRYERS